MTGPQVERVLPPAGPAVAGVIVGAAVARLSLVCWLRLPPAAEAAGAELSVLPVVMGLGHTVAVCTATHPLGTRFAKIIGASLSKIG